MYTFKKIIKSDPTGLDARKIVHDPNFDKPISEVFFNFTNN